MKCLNIVKTNNNFNAQFKDEYKIQVNSCDLKNLLNLLVDDLIIDAKWSVKWNNHKYSINGCGLKTVEGNNIYFVHQDDNNLPCLFLYGSSNGWILSDNVNIAYTELVENYGYTEVVTNENLTKLEKQVLFDICQEDGNGEYIMESYFHSQYLSVLLIDLPMTQLRGVLASLVKKGYIELKKDEFDTILIITDKYIEYYNKYLK